MSQVYWWAQQEHAKDMYLLSQVRDMRLSTAEVDVKLVEAAEI